VKLIIQPVRRLLGSIERWTTEVIATDRRVLLVDGFTSRHTQEMSMSEIESVDVDQDWIGRLLNYGDVTIRGTGTTL
jgi:hypothetical protein